jgi:predicted Rossmann fold nucleotide-binding protein DprA/Smf involved in DNA uptake
VNEELPTPAQAVLTKAEQPAPSRRNELLAASLDSSQEEIYELPSSDKAVHIDDIVERSGLNSSDVLATLFAAGMNRIVRQRPGTAVS